MVTDKQSHSNDIDSYSSELDQVVFEQASELKLASSRTNVNEIICTNNRFQDPDTSL